MSHHGFEDPERQKALSAAMRQLMGEYPNGRLNANDAGGIAMSVGVEEGRVRLDFAKPVAWIGLTPDEAVGLAEILVKHARSAGSNKPFVLRLGA